VTVLFAISDGMRGGKERVVPVSRRVRRNATYATRESTPIGAARATLPGEGRSNGGVGKYVAALQCEVARLKDLLRHGHAECLCRTISSAALWRRCRVP
jgi:hypothetical protein